MVPALSLAHRERPAPTSTVLAADDLAADRVAWLADGRASRSEASPRAVVDELTADTIPIVDEGVTPLTTARRAPAVTLTTTKPRANVAAATTTTTAKPKPPPSTTTTTAKPRNQQTGEASYYDGAASGTCAHRTLPLGTIVTVTNLANGRSVTCRIADRGPYVDGRIIDLSRSGFDAISPMSEGVIDVRIEW